ncbi:MAG: hypothetical protein Q8P59_10410 [Dehalococcoidia bacterium]|nr:hypothetical protein [Dehalococcoidia bacterium]
MTFSVLNFIRSAIIYLVIGSTMGVLMAVNPQWGAPLRTAHAHINLLGWVSMMIFGVGYHVLPRFRGKQLHSEGIAIAQLILVNIGIVGLAVFSVLFNLYGGDFFKAVVAIAGAIEVVGIYLFAYNMIRTMELPR